MKQDALKQGLSWKVQPANDLQVVSWSSTGAVVDGKLVQLRAGHLPRYGSLWCILPKSQVLFSKAAEKHSICSRAQVY